MSRRVQAYPGVLLRPTAASCRWTTLQTVSARCWASTCPTAQETLDYASWTPVARLVEEKEHFGPERRVQLN